jgi:hypothetical protein
MALTKSITEASALTSLQPKSSLSRDAKPDAGASHGLIFVANAAAIGCSGARNKRTNQQRQCREDGKARRGLAGGVGCLARLNLRILDAGDRIIDALLGISLRKTRFGRNQLRGGTSPLRMPLARMRVACAAASWALVDASIRSARNRPSTT